MGRKSKYDNLESIVNIIFVLGLLIPILYLMVMGTIAETEDRKQVYKKDSYVKTECCKR